MRKAKSPMEDILANRSFDRRHCFLCGIKLIKKNISREHVFPKFALRLFNLWNQKLTLINGMAIPYRKIVIPCCRTCNNVHIGRLDKKLATYVRGGFKKFRKLDEQSIFQWLSRILYSILYLELITPRDPRYKRRKILRKKFFEILETVFLFLNSVRVKTTFHKPYPWSLFIFKTQKHAKPELNFDFKDNPLLMTVALRMNDIGVVGVLQDNGAVRMMRERAIGIDKARQLELHPVQFSEVTAKIFYLASLLNRVPKYMTVAPPSGQMEVVALPIGGLSAKPIFKPWKNEDFARALSWSCRLPYDELYFPGRGVWTFLHDEAGTPRHIPFE
jgi:hypothetical protein